eukprot:470647-Amphidinium_carterae.1
MSIPFVPDMDELVRLRSLGEDSIVRMSTFDDEMTEAQEAVKFDSVLVDRSGKSEASTGDDGTTSDTVEILGRLRGFEQTLLSGTSQHLHGLSWWQLQCLRASLHVRDVGNPQKGQALDEVEKAAIRFVVAP